MIFFRRAACAVLSGAQFFMVFSSPAFAQPSRESLSALMSRIQISAQKIRDVHARVSQKKYFADMADEVTFHGTMVYARPRRMLWTFTDPDPSSLLIVPKGVWLTIPGIRQVQKIGPQGQANIAAFFLGFEGSFQRIQKEYRMEQAGTETLEQGKADIVKFTSATNPFVKETWIWFDQTRGLPLRVRWAGAQGDTTTTDFFDIRINQGADARVFEAAVPAGYELIVSEE